MANIKKKNSPVRCRSCGSASSLVFEENELEYCIACYSCYSDPLKKLTRDKK